MHDGDPQGPPTFKDVANTTKLNAVRRNLALVLRDVEHERLVRWTGAGWVRVHAEDKQVEVEAGGPS